MTRTCPWCKREFAAKTDQQIYCSDYCKRKLWEHNHKNSRTPRPYVPIERPAQDPIKKCPKDCRYRANAGGMESCDYILVNYEPRGCEGGKHCKRYKKL